jgi:Asp-tRNA(Asn)/Glu-tRNA(Gln) amidotransferase A subunit family amidase
VVAPTRSQLLEAQLARIASREKLVRAWSWHDPQQVRDQLAALPKDTSHLPLAGITVGVKDIFDTSDMPTTYGSAAFANHRPQRDASAVTKLRAAGALIMGKTVTTEFAHQHAGPTTNPHSVDRTPGGSSSGSAAAVADEMVTMALGSQTGGSTIRPAAFCGIVGFKPTHGKVSLEGVGPLSVTMDTIGLMARSMTDICLLSSVLLESDALSQAPARPRVAWYPSPEAPEADPDALRALERARDVLKAAGVQIVDIDLPAKDFLALGQSNRLIMAYEAARSYETVYRNKAADLGASTVQLIETGLLMTDEQFKKELLHVEKCKALFAKAMLGVDAVLTLGAPGQAPLKSTGTGLSTFNRVWTTLGVPCITLPFGRGDAGLPLGVQFVGALGADSKLLALGTKFEALFADHASV